MNSGYPLDRVTFSSDSNGSLPKFDDQGHFIGMGVGRIDVLRQCLCRLILDHGLNPETALSFVTSNPARRLGPATRTGRLVPCLDADLTVFDENWRVRAVYCRGRLMVENGKCTSSYLF